MGKANKQQKNKNRKRARKLKRALESKQRALKYGQRAAQAVGLKDALDDDDADEAIKERILGLMWAAGLVSWVWCKEGTASATYASLAEHAFTMAGQSLESSLVTEEDAE